MINSRQKDLVSSNRVIYPASKKFLRTNIEPEQFYSDLRAGNYVDLDSLRKGMTYRIVVNGGSSFYTTTALCTGIKRLGGEVLYAKFNFKGGSALVRGNYELVYYCQHLVH